MKETHVKFTLVNHTEHQRKMDVRKSQQPVNFNNDGSGWEIRESVDASSPPPHVQKKAWPITSPSSANVQPVRSSSPVLARCKNCAELTSLRAELKSAQETIDHLKKTVVMQQKLMHGLCSLNIHVQ